MKKGIVLTECFYPEDFLINDLVQEWHQMGFEVEVLTAAPSYPFGKIYPGYKNKLYQQTDFKGVKVHRFPFVPGYQSHVLLKILNYCTALFFTAAVLLFKGRRYDRIFIYHIGPLTIALAAILAKKLYKTKITIWTQDPWPDTVYAFGFKKTAWLEYCLGKLVKFVYRNCDTVVVSCEGFAGRVHDYVPQKEVEYVPNWPLMAETAAVDIVLPGRFNFTFAGNLGKLQNLENVVLGFGLFAKNHPDAFLNLVGDGSNLSNLKELAAANHITNINFTGRKPLGEMPAYFEASDVLVISLLDEPIYKVTIPSKFQTYLTAAKPIFAIMRGEVANLVEKHTIGLCASPSDQTEIALGFEKLYTMDASAYATISDNAAKLLQNDFSKEKSVKKLADLFWE